MRKTSSQRLKTVLKLAQLQERRAAERLADSIRNAEQESAQLDQLQKYKLEYTENFQSVGRAGVSAALLANYQQFYGNLEGAGNTQSERAVLASAQQEQARQQWQQQYARQNNMQSLIERKAMEEQRLKEVRSQKEQDDRRRNPAHFS